MRNRYQDYVIKDGQFVGKFDEMYRHSDEIPWHQDETVDAIFSDLTVALLKKRRIRSLLDVGCGLGFMTERFRLEIPELKYLVGLDISETAISKAKQMFPEITFIAGTVNSLRGDNKYDVVVSKDVLWYVLNTLSDYLTALAKISNRWIYIGQSFPESKDFYGKDIFPDANSLIKHLKDNVAGEIVYSLIEKDADYSNREYVHIIVELERANT